MPKGEDLLKWLHKFKLSYFNYSYSFREVFLTRN